MKTKEKEEKWNLIHWISLSERWGVTIKEILNMKDVNLFNKLYIYYTWFSNKLNKTIGRLIFSS